MADLEQLKQRYQPVLKTIEKEGAELNDVSLAGDQLSLKATAVSEASKNRIWDSIKAVDPTFSDLKHDIEVREGNRSTQCRLATTCRKSVSTFTVTRTSIRRSPQRIILPTLTKSKLGRSS
jgi:hypothetical protein